MTSTLQRLLANGLVHGNDDISFNFKGHTFSAKIVQGGLIAHCTWNGAAVLQDKVAFTTLTDWADTCIQELVNEYVTRFSSWKRVRHLPTGNSFAQLRDKLKPGQEGTGCRCPEIQVMRRRVIALEQQIADMQRPRKPRQKLKKKRRQRKQKLMQLAR